MSVTNERDHVENKVRDILAIHDRNAQLEDDNARLRHSLDLARQKLEHFSADLDRALVQRDHYLAQVVAFREKFGQLKETHIQLARMVMQMINDSTAQQARIENASE